MLRIAIYARYSSDQQNAKSVDDQIDECKDFISETYTEKVELLLKKLSFKFLATRLYLVKIKSNAMDLMRWKMQFEKAMLTC